MTNDRIYKYQIDVDDNPIVNLPEGARVLSVGCQDSALFLWAEVNPNNPPKARQLYVRGTGHPLGNLNGARFIGTANMMDGRLMWHVYEENPDD